jgi:hypothetical protein
MSMHSKTLLSSSVLSAMLLVAAVVRLTAVAPPAPLEGVWRTVEVVVQSPTPQVFKPAATLAIFQGRHYSRVEVHAEGPRPVLKDPAAASASELRATWGPFVGEAGTFEVTGNEITMQALVAKNPAAMMKGATSVYSYQRNGDTLTLTQLRTHLGPSPAPVTIKLVRVE